VPVLAAVLYWWRILRRPLHPVLKRARVGGFTIVGGAVALAGCWLGWRPDGTAAVYLGGEFAGVLSVYALTWAILTATRSPWLEQWFGGLDRMYRWHRWCASTGVLLLVPHKLLLNAAPDETANPVGLVLGVVAALGLAGLAVVSLTAARRWLRLSYERWLQSHRLTGLLVIGASVHGLLVDRVVAASPPLLVVYLLVVATGALGYIYQQLFARRTRRAYRYRVDAVRTPDSDLLELDLQPTSRALNAQPGQFVYLTVDQPPTAEHPLSVAGIRPGGGIRLAIKAAGDDTRRLHQQIRVGATATLTGPYGRFDHRLGGLHQLWIAGGAGIVPFLGWLDLPLPETTIDLFYSTSSPATAHHLEELVAAAAALPALRLHTVFTNTEPRLTAATIDAATPGHLADRDAFLCGPPAMISTLRRGLRRAGIPADQLHTESY
jgi:predicted ferric reductase